MVLVLVLLFLLLHVAFEFQIPDSSVYDSESRCELRAESLLPLGLLDHGEIEGMSGCVK